MRDKTFTISSESAEDTFRLGYRLGGIAKGIICLEGEMGSGKTVLSKGIAKRLDMDEYVGSPTFNIINYYEKYDCEFYHMDAYRIDDSDMLQDIGFEDILDPDGITVIEWADKIRDHIPYFQLWVQLLRMDEDNKRLIIMTGNEELINQLGSEWEP
ncbi:MAG: tRNA (adenosine(37)-N6)-threonylcarbamoyltransferase complex ATPase subunit type 1 TsaE [Clostridia bacterium]